MKRGEVWDVRYEPIGSTVGREQAGTRPALIVSADSFLEAGRELVHVCPITSTLTPYPSRIFVHPPEGGIVKPSAIIGEQVRTFSVERFLRRRGIVSPTTMARVEDVLRIVLGLGAP